MTVQFAEEKLRALCKGLEVENIDRLMQCDVTMFYALGKVIADQAKLFSRGSDILEALVKAYNYRKTKGERRKAKG